MWDEYRPPRIAVQPITRRTGKYPNLALGFFRPGCCTAFFPPFLLQLSSPANPASADIHGKPSAPAHDPPFSPLSSSCTHPPALSQKHLIWSVFPPQSKLIPDDSIFSWSFFPSPAHCLYYASHSCDLCLMPVSFTRLYIHWGHMFPWGSCTSVLPHGRCSRTMLKDWRTMLLLSSVETHVYSLLIVVCHFKSLSSIGL